MVETSMLEKMIDFAYGALIFLILVGIAFAVYQIFWAKTPTVAEQNLDSVFSELKELKKDACFDVVLRPTTPYTLVLFPGGNDRPECSGQPCLCITNTGSTDKCIVIPNEKNDCNKGLCVVTESRIPAVVSSVNICNSNNELSIKLSA